MKVRPKIVCYTCGGLLAQWAFGYRRPLRFQADKVHGLHARGNGTTCTIPAQVFQLHLQSLVWCSAGSCNEACFTGAPILLATEKLLSCTRLGCSGSLNHRTIHLLKRTEGELRWLPSNPWIC